MSYCPCCPQNETNFNNPLPSDNFHHQPSSTNAYHHAWYHYQSYLYYWNLCNAQNTHNIPLCECYEDARQSSNHYSSVYSNRCTDCTDGYRTNRDEGQFNTHRGPTSDVQFTDSNNYSEHQNQGDYNYDCDDNDDEEFEVDENFYHFLKQSQKHKEEREKSKRELAKTDEYVEVGKRQITASTLPPEEHQGTKRKKAMEELYGDQASFIMSLEASLQLHFDRNFDEKQPIFWPNIPLKF